MAGTVLLTGATGLLGRLAITPLIERGFDVLAASRSGDDIAQATGIAADILDPAQMAGVFDGRNVSHLLHLAWHNGASDRWTSPANHEWNRATLELIRAFANAGGQRVVAAGSCAEYQWGDKVLSESSPLRQATSYGQAKAKTGSEVMAEAPVLGISLAWARIFFCYGPGEPEGRLLGDLIEGISAGKTVACTDGKQERDYLHSADIGRALAAVLDSDVEGAINVASGQATPVKDLIMEVAAQMGHPELVDLGAKERPENDPPRVVADISKLEQRTDFKPFFDIPSGVADVLKTKAQ